LYISVAEFNYGGLCRPPAGKKFFKNRIEDFQEGQEVRLAALALPWHSSCPPVLKIPLALPKPEGKT